MTQEMKRKGWIVLWAAIGMNFFVGLGYIWSIIGKELMNQLGWSSVQSSMPYTVFSIAFALSMTIAGPLQDKKGPRFVSMVGSLIIGCGLIITGFFLHPVSMIFTYGLMVGFGIGAIYSASVPAAMKWFSKEKKGMVNGIVVAMVALASVMYSPLAKGLMTRFGISPTFWFIGTGVLVIVFALSRLLANPPEDLLTEGTEQQDKKKKPEVNVPTREMLKTGNFYKLWFMFILSTFSCLMIVGHAANIAKVQVGWEGGVLLVSLLSLCNAAGRFLGGTISDKIGRPNTMRIVFAISAVNILLFRFYHHPAILAVGVGVAGICYGVCMVVFSVSTSDLYGMKYFGGNYGFVFTAWGIAGVLGPIIAAVIFDKTGTYMFSYYIAAALGAIALIISFTLKGFPNPKRKAAATPAPE